MVDCTTGLVVVVVIAGVEVAGPDAVALGKLLSINPIICLIIASFISAIERKSY